MPSQFESIAEKSRPIFYEFFGTTATYTQGATELEVRFIQANPADRMRTEEEFAVWAEYSEWVCKTADLGSVVPAKGDTIEAEGGEVWTVLSPEGRPEYEFIDPEEVEIRIFAKRR